MNLRKRDVLFLAVLLLVGWWAVPHIKEDVARAIVPDAVERLFPRLIDRLTRRREVSPAEFERRMESHIEVSRLVNVDPPAVAAAGTIELDHGYGW